MAEFRCWLPATGDAEDGMIVHAFDAWFAAKQFAAKYDSESGGEVSHGMLRDGHERLRVHVLTEDGIETTWDVSCEATIQWYARAAGIVQRDIKAVHREEDSSA